MKYVKCSRKLDVRQGKYAFWKYECYVNAKSKCTMQVPWRKSKNSRDTYLRDTFRVLFP